MESDYIDFVDGKPREDGIRDFLAARGITLSQGDRNNPTPGTIAGLAAEKNAAFHRLLKEVGVRVYPDALAFISRARDAGLRLAMVTSSRNGPAILRAAGLEHSFEVTADGNDLVEKHLPGKPAPDLFLLAARRLGVAPARCAVVEDALAGVEAGRAGRFGRVIGLTRRRPRDAQSLRRVGADVALRDLNALQVRCGENADTPGMPDALEALPEIADRAKGKRLAIFLDYDGTLTPIVDRPEWATLSQGMRSALETLAKRATVAIVSGRDRADVEHMVNLPQVYYAGSHGFDISGPGSMRMQHDRGVAAKPDLQQAEEELRAALKDIDGLLIEPKGFALAVHYRLVAPDQLEQVEAVVKDVAARHPKLRRTGGKKIHEFRPDIDWDKGRAVSWVLRALDLDREDTLAIYLGDDETDEDAFQVLAEVGIGVRVGPPGDGTQARYILPDTTAVKRFLERLAAISRADGDNDRQESS